MSLEHAILGFLRYQPMSGYTLKKAFDNSVRHFWPADQGQIYRTLARITGQGWAVQEVVSQEDHPDRKVYHVTDEGRRELRSWLLAPLRQSDERSAELVQVFFAGQLSDEEILAMFLRAAEQLRSLLAVYEAIPRDAGEHVRSVHSERELYCWLLTLEAGIATAKANLVWVDSVIERIKRGELPTG